MKIRNAVKEQKTAAAKAFSIKAAVARTNAAYDLRDFPALEKVYGYVASGLKNRDATLDVKVKEFTTADGVPMKYGYIDISVPADKASEYISTASRFMPIGVFGDAVGNIYATEFGSHPKDIHFDSVKGWEEDTLVYTQPGSSKGRKAVRVSPERVAVSALLGLCRGSARCKNDSGAPRVNLL